MIKNPIPTAWQILMNSRWSAGSRRVWSACCRNVLDGGGRTLSAPADEEGSLADKVLGEVGELLDGFGHGGRGERGVEREVKRRGRAYRVGERAVIDSRTIWPSGVRSTGLVRSGGACNIRQSSLLSLPPLFSSSPLYLFPFSPSQSCSSPSLRPVSLNWNCRLYWCSPFDVTRPLHHRDTIWSFCILQD